MGKLRIGVIGAGQIAEVSHIPNYSRHADKVDVIAVCDVNLERAKYIANKFGIPKVYQDYRKMLENESLDAVSVCVTNKYHSVVTVNALNAGCHVLCEKPPAINYAEALKMYEAVQKNKKILTFNFHYRHSSEVKAIKELIDKGVFGDIYAARVQALRRRGIPGWGTFINKELQGGGPLIDIGIHTLDTALYLMGYPEPECVLACTYQKIGNRPGIGLMGSWDYTKFTVEDSAFGFIRFKDGSCINIETSFALNIKESKVMNVHLFGEKAGASVFPAEIYSENGSSLTNIELPFLPEVDKHYESITDFIMSCIEGKLPVCKVEEALMIQKIIDAMYESAEKGQPMII